MSKMQEGITLYLTIAVLSILTTLLLSLSGISVSQIKVLWGLSDSVVAFYAADTGIEQGLYQIRKQENYNSIPQTLLGQASYNVFITTTTDEIIMKSVSKCKETRRAIEVRY